DCLGADSAPVLFGHQRLTTTAPRRVRLPKPPRLRKSTGKKVTTVTGPRPSFGSLPAYVELIDSHGATVAPPVGGVKLPVSQRALDIARTGRGSYYADAHLHGIHLRIRVSPATPRHPLLVPRSLPHADPA